jgi:Uma2 family endonuclease
MTVTERIAPVVTLEEVHRFTAEEYDRMIAAGAFAGMRVELIDGYLVDMHARGEPHEAIVEWLNDWLHDHVDRTIYRIRIGASLRVWPSQPEPDVMLVPRTKPKGEQPTRSPFAIEVSHTSRKRDLEVKPTLYSAVIAEYWVVDIDERRVVVHRDPVPGGYRTVTTHPPDASLAPLVLPDQPMSFRELFEQV